MALQTKTITANGSKGHHKFTLEVTENSISTSDNTSSLSFAFKISSLGGGYDWYGWSSSISYTVNINGSKYTGTIPDYDGSSTVTLKSGSLSVEHNSDGSKSISVSFSVTDGAGQYYTCGNASASGSMTLNTIARASTIICSGGNIGRPTTIKINKADFSFTETLTYEFGSLAGTIKSNVTGSSIQWTIPTNFYTQIPNSNSGTGTIFCKTYNGSTLIGTTTCTFTAKVTNSNPIVGTFTYKDSNDFTVAITENNQRIIRENSNLLFTIGSATALNSATISKYEVTFNGETKSLTSTGNLNFGIVNLANNSTATLKVIDSRGNSSTKEITVIIDDWMLPTGVISLNRKNNYYSETYLKVDGTYSSLNGKNSMAIQYQYKKVTEKSFSPLYDLADNTQKNLDLDNNYQWHIIVVVGDRIGETTYNLFLDRGMPIIFFDRIKSSVGVNCFPTENETFQVNGQHLPVACSEGEINGFDGVGIGEKLNKSGLYTVCDYYDGVGTWYNLINLRHRNGFSDGTVYGMQIRQRLISSNDKLQIRQQNNGNWGSWRNIQEEPVTLFENAGGTTNNITLVESAGNFQFMEIFYVDNNGRSNKSVRVHSPQLKNIELSCIEPAPDNSPIRTYIRSSLWIINGTSITHNKSTFTTLTSEGVTVTNNQYIKIYRVVGYR